MLKENKNPTLRMWGNKFEKIGKFEKIRKNRKQYNILNKLTIFLYTQITVIKKHNCVRRTLYYTLNGNDFKTFGA